MAYLGLTPKKTGSVELDSLQKEPSVMQDSTSEEAKRLAAAAALSAVKDAAAATAAAAGRGKVEVSTSFSNTLLIDLLCGSCNRTFYGLGSHEISLVKKVNGLY